MSGCLGKWLGKACWQGQEGTFRGDGNVLCLSQGGGYIGLWICHRSLNCTLKMVYFTLSELFQESNFLKKNAVLLYSTLKNVV